MSEVEKEYFNKVIKEFEEVFDSPIVQLGKYWNKSRDINDVIEVMVEGSYAKQELRALYVSAKSIKLKVIVLKRLKNLSNAESFIMNL